MSRPSKPEGVDPKEDSDDEIPIHIKSKEEINAMKAKLDELRMESSLPAHARIVMERAAQASKEMNDVVSMGHQTLAATSVHLVDHFKRIPASELTEAIKEKFNTWDINKNGSLERSEIQQAMAEMGKRPTDGEVDELFEFFDTNKSGTIELDEFDKMVRINLKMLSLDSLREQREQSAGDDKEDKAKWTYRLDGRGFARDPDSRPGTAASKRGEEK
eukprot:CAMPEP_0181344124 /NCGR_PEP_ID=MMETSP1101-20121128/32003_1 /TAXON_ID=46948 /ORGANISM="Rhodomonas abbreviata, Strain Caron Lab Isolate" /LENGTH=216 /DNA_ID=CAMNT_0023455901 /DNA_START=27 /DNA_END=674 /DNA_ORIENTATION=-